MDYKKLNQQKIQLNFTTKNFNSKGEISNTKILTFANDIEPNFADSATLQCRTSKFRMKTDILKLREIVRKKFVIFARQHKCLENQQAIDKQNDLYGKLNEGTMFIMQYLDEIESNGFNDMRSSQIKLQSFQQNQIGDELEKLLTSHQCIMMEVHELCNRVNLLLKIISCFDIIIYPNENIIVEPDSCSVQNTQLKAIENNNVDCTISMNNSQKIQSLNLNDAKCLEADLWIQGYECVKQKIFNFHRRLTDVAKLHYFLFQINESTEKCLAKPIEFAMLNNAIDLKKRALYLKQRSIYVLDKLESKQRIDDLHITLKALVPVIWTKIRKKIIEYHYNEIGIISEGMNQNINIKNGILTMIEDIQRQLMEIFHAMEQIPDGKCKRIEKYLRKRIEIQNNASRRSLIEENRVHNLILHYKKHHLLQK